MSSRHPIIAHGELYAEAIAKPLGGGSKLMPRDYPEAKQRILSDLESLSNKMTSKTEVFLSEKILCVRLEPKFEAKSFVPTSLVAAMSRGNAEIVGGRKYESADDDGNTVTAKLYFIRTADIGIRQLTSVLQSGERDHFDNWQHQIQSINSIDLLHPEEKVMGFGEDWTAGIVEFVLHPMHSKTDEIQRFFDLSGIDRDIAHIKTYDGGITFISAECTDENINRAKIYNPLRATHPLGRVSIMPIRDFNGQGCPSIQKVKTHPDVCIGVFDGGVANSISLLNGYVNAIEGTSEPAHPQLVAHGSGVCSAVLHGNLGGKTSKDKLDAPCVTIICYRLLPIKNDLDFDLYEAIDYIEEVVPKNTDVRLYNLSFGPQGAIIDDSISRFTYALDKLSYEVTDGINNPLFVVAVGNEGHLPPKLNRVQSPSDMVNGLGVGAYTLDCSNKKIPTEYSCIGPGREGAKTKPDLLEFGGSVDRPFIIPNIDGVGLSATIGTSFAAPVVTGKIGRLMASSSSITPHMARTLLVHNAMPDSSVPHTSQGFGYCTANVLEVLECIDNSPTIMYSGSILPSQFLSLPVFIPHINEMKGNVKISWTVALIVDPYSNDPDAYTNNCLDDVFSPHSMIYNFSKKGHGTVKLNLLDSNTLPRVKQLLNDGYCQSATPVSHPAKKAWDEKDLRNADLKWDTVIHKNVSMRCSSLFNPTLTLHAIARNGFESRSIKYHVLITIDAPKYNGSLYDTILQTYQNLSPVELRSTNRLIV